MRPTKFIGASLIPGPKSIPQVPAVYALAGIDYNDEQPLPFILEAWEPSEADKKVMASGGKLWIKTYTTQLQPMVIFTTDEKGNPNK